MKLTGHTPKTNSLPSRHSQSVRTCLLVALMGAVAAIGACTMRSLIGATP